MRFIRLLAILAGAAMAAGCSALPPEAAGDGPCSPTRGAGLGPMYRPNAPERAGTGQGLVVSGTVRSTAGCAPLSGARLEWWSANPSGAYDDAHRASHRADAQGHYRYQTDVPGGYGFFRRPHLHVRVTSSGHRPLVTQLYPEAGQTALSVDFVLIPE